MIAGLAGALSEDYGPQLDEAARDYLNEIASAAARMNSQVQDLLDYGRLGRINIPVEPVNVLHSVAEALRQAGDEHNPAVHLDVREDVWVCAYPQVLTQAMFNLISNGLKFCSQSSQPVVRIWTEEHDGRVRISINDNGIGIAPQHQERIWNVFERLHNREEYPGSGIGLAIVKRAIVRMQGNYGVDSEVGKGSTFWIELPYAASPV